MSNPGMQQQTVRCSDGPDEARPFAAVAKAGMVLLVCSESGEIIRDGGRLPHGEHWLSDLFCNSGLFRACLKDAHRQWAGHPGGERGGEAGLIQAMPGLWLAPMPVASATRRRRAGHTVAVIPTYELVHAEQLAAMCQAARMDLELCRNRLAKLTGERSEVRNQRSGLTSDLRPPTSDLCLPSTAIPAEVKRLATLVRHAHESQARAESDRHAVESVGQQLAESYEEMNLLYTIIQNMTVQERPERFIALACKELHNTLPYAWIGLQFGDDRTRLKSLAGRLIVAGDPGQPPPTASALRMATTKLLQQARPDLPMVLEPSANPKHAVFAALGKTALVHPVSENGEVIGVLLAGDKRGPDATASNIDIKLLGAAATNIAIFLENAALYDDLNAMFMGTLEALTASIDAKDRYTCGHSRRVAHLTQQTAQAIGLDEHTVARCRIAGLVHDVGKIGVPEAVLLKPGKLTVEEFAWIRRHPEIGYRILKDIPQLNDILPGVLHHHERWDGRGYPQGLCGEAIPLMARLISLADSFDAMSSTRTYRSALSRRQVLDEIHNCVGTQFDPELARTFLKLDFAVYDRMAQEHRASEMGDAAPMAAAAPRERAA